MNAEGRGKGLSGAMEARKPGTTYPDQLIPSFRTLLILLALTALGITGCLTFLAFRVVLLGNPFYTFLGVNLLLACVPLGLASIQVILLRAVEPCHWRSGFIAACAAGWLLFYPNAPYLFTDFIHLAEKTWIRGDPTRWLGVRGVLWYDIVMSGAFAFVGHFLGLLSMWVEGRVLDAAWGRIPARIFLAFAALLSGYGVYLGRFVRLYSWDAVLAPGKVVEGFVGILSDPKAALFSLAFSFFVAVTYGMMVLAISLRDPPKA
ncbi:MAG TPA: DUF1361 domain-containing protein [Magnetospirillaceae bacterium]|nr:DUF1361 domain-containing protein [Magnetospirillaceae bacterium]